ncbi:hypothetical protein [Streptomyces sp. NPDC091217]|uniref:hypothetical protein n=1 Tax=Streptomyces sp. NPDC091217 TaxID=3365975 RepID=UPI003818E2CE
MPLLKVCYEDCGWSAAVTPEPAGGCPRWFEEVDRGTVDGLGRVRRTRGALVTLDAPDTVHVLRP